MQGTMNSRSFRNLLLAYTGLMLLFGSLMILRDSLIAPSKEQHHEQGAQERTGAAQAPRSSDPSKARHHGLLAFVVLASGVVTFVFSLYLGMISPDQSVRPLTWHS